MAWSSPPSCYSKGLTPAIDRWGLLDKGFAYDVVAVFGSQSTGKSEPSSHARSTFMARVAGPPQAKCSHVSRAGTWRSLPLLAETAVLPPVWLPVAARMGAHNVISRRDAL